MGFRENLKSELVYLDMPVKELAAKSGINKLTIDHWLSAKGKIPLLDNGVKIAQALGVSAEYLVTGENSGLPRDIHGVIRNLPKLCKKNRRVAAILVNALLESQEEKL